MAKISKQWLGKGWGIRDRGYRPVEVCLDIKAVPADRYGPAGIHIRLTRSNGEYQIINLDSVDVDELGVAAVSIMSQKAREQAAVKLFSGVSNAKLLRILALELRRRVRLPAAQK